MSTIRKLGSETSVITKLEKKQLRRELMIDGTAYVLTIDARTMTLTLKGRRKGLVLHWKDLVSGDAALATALHASLAADSNLGVDSAPGERVAATPRTRKAAKRPRAAARLRRS